LENITISHSGTGLGEGEVRISVGMSKRKYCKKVRRKGEGNEVKGKTRRISNQGKSAQLSEGREGTRQEQGQPIK